MSLFETIILDGNTTYKISPKKAEDIGLSYIDKNRSKFVIDGKEVNSSYLSMIKEIEGKTYLSLEDALKLPQMKMYKLNNRKI